MPNAPSDGGEHLQPIASAQDHYANEHGCYDERSPRHLSAGVAKQRESHIENRRHQQGDRKIDNADPELDQLSCQATRREE